MSHTYRAVGWTPFKRRYDLALGAGLGAYLLAFVGAMAWLHPSASAETVVLRALGSAAFLLLFLVLAIGPLCRLDRRWLPLLANRRHLGVALFGLALAHGAFALVQYHGFGDTNPFVSLLTADGDWSRPADWPFQPFGALALGILFLMAATSHDAWLAALTPPAWKALHMLVYVAWAALLAHVGFGVVHDELGAPSAALLAAASATLVVLHLCAARRESLADDMGPAGAGDVPVDAGPAATIPEGRARVVNVAGDRVAVFRHEDRLYAVSNACRHQNGPLGEGRILDGCITCPWHGYQYRPQDGASPPPFTEKVPTFRVELRDGHACVDPRPALPGTPQAGCALGPTAEGVPAVADEGPFFVIWQPTAPPASARRMRRAARGLVFVAILLGVALAAAQGPFRPSAFEFGVERSFTGVLHERPVPHLALARPDARPLAQGEPVPSSRWLLTGPFKSGAQALVAGLDGRLVRARGSLAWREGETLLELVARPEPLAAAEPEGEVEPSGAGAGVHRAAADRPVPLGEVELDGQIVDSKCWIGVMNPADTRSHRACAVRCLSGGIPAVLMTRAEDGSAACLLLVGRDGRELNAEILDLVAQPVRVRGEVERLDDLLVLHTEPGEIERLGD